MVPTRVPSSVRAEIGQDRFGPFTPDAEEVEDTATRTVADKIFLMSIDLARTVTPPPDSDNDGVADATDQCPDTPIGVIVDENGCPVICEGPGARPHLLRRVGLTIPIVMAMECLMGAITVLISTTQIRLTQMATALATRVSAPPGEPEFDPVFCYAPQVRLHPAEFTFPMDIAEFVAHSTLKFAHAKCGEDVFPGAVDPLRLGAGALDPYAARQKRRFICAEKGREYFANELTRPHDKSKSRPRELGKHEGFYLDLDDEFRLGAQPDAENKVHTRAYYSFASGSSITYWFMYGYNQGSPFFGGLGTLVDRHEGEWERITVDLKPDNTPRQVRYWVHDCEEPITVAWDGVPKVEETHPVVFSALGAHTSYPDERDVPLEGLCPLPLGKKTKIALELILGFDIDKVGQGAGDQTLDDGPQWETWRDLANISLQAWYGYGGAWGANGTFQTGGPVPCTTASEAISSCNVTVTGPARTRLETTLRLELTRCRGHSTLAVTPGKEPRWVVRRYPEEFRREAVQLALASDESRAAVERRLGVNETTLRNWVAAQLAEEARQADPLAVTAVRVRRTAPVA